MKVSGSIYKAGLLGLLVGLLAGCTPATTDNSVGAEESSSETARRFDPLELPHDSEVVPLEHPQHGGGLQPHVADSTGSGAAFIGEGDSLNSQAFRIQLLSTKVYGEGRRAQRVAEEVFDRPVFLDYEVPYYKLRVGSFADRPAAERYLQRAKAAGYGDAWLVVVNVNVRELDPLYQEAIPLNLNEPPEAADDSSAQRRDE